VWRTWFVWHNIIIYWIMYEYESYKNMYLNNIFETWLLYLISFMKCDCCIVYFCFFWQNYYILISKLLFFFFLLHTDTKFSLLRWPLSIGKFVGHTWQAFLSHPNFFHTHASKIKLLNISWSWWLGFFYWKFKNS
jgi:hypothetical protein